MLWKAVWLLAISIACSATVLPLEVADEWIDDKQANVSLEVTNVRIGENQDNGVLLHRYRRGWSSLFFTGTTFLLKATTLGVSLGAALSNGCNVYPSICTYRDNIEYLDKSSLQLKSQYRTEYRLAKQDFYNLKTAITHNAYISYYTNHTLQTVELLPVYAAQLVDEFELKLPTYNLTFDEYLEEQMVPLEFRLFDIKNMLETRKNTALLNIAIQYLVEITVSMFLNSFQKAYNMVDSEDILASTHKGIFELLDDVNLYKVAKNGRGIKQKLKLVPKAFKQIGKNIAQKFRNIKSSAKRWTKIKSWKGFKGKLKHTFRKPFAKLKSSKNFIMKPAVRAKYAKNYKLSWSQRISTGVGMIGDAIQIAYLVKDWGKIANEMKEANKKYQEYNDKLKSNLDSLRKERTERAKIWDETIGIFKDITTIFRSLMINASHNSIFSEVVGLPKLPVDTNSPLFKIDFNTLVQTSLASNQLAVINFLKDVDNNMTGIEDEMKARLVLYQNARSKSKNSEPISDIFAEVQNILRFSSSQTIRNFGNQLKRKDLVCTVSIIRTDISEYDYFPLKPFRPRCEVNTTAFQDFSSDALSHRKSKLMRQIVIKSVNGRTKESRTGLLDVVHNAYLGVSDSDVAAFGSSVTDRDIICMISEEYPSKQTYDFINLEPFRPDCSFVASTDYSKLIADATKLRKLASGIRNSLETCKNYSFCPCLTQVAIQNQVTVGEVEQILTQLDPNWEPNQATLFCGPTGCECKHL